MLFKSYDDYAKSADDEDVEESNKATFNLSLNMLSRPENQDENALSIGKTWTTAIHVNLGVQISCFEECNIFEQFATFVHFNDVCLKGLPARQKWLDRWARQSVTKDFSRDASASKNGVTSSFLENINWEVLIICSFERNQGRKSRHLGLCQNVRWLHPASTPQGLIPQISPWDTQELKALLKHPWIRGFQKIQLFKFNGCPI